MSAYRALWIDLGADVAALLRNGEEIARGTGAVIAAAPNLLAALREIAETPCDHGPGFCARKIAQAALEQAEGRGA